MKILYKPESFDGTWKVRAENLEEGAVLRKICIHHDIGNCEFSVKTNPLVEHGLLKDERPLKDTPVPKYVKPSWEIRTVDGGIFLAVRYDKEAAERCAADFGQWWPGGCSIVGLNQEETHD